MNTVPILSKRPIFTDRIHWHNSDFHSHNYWEGVLVTKGTAHHVCNGERRDIFPRQIFIVRPQDIHAYTESVDDKIGIHTDYEHRDIYIDDQNFMSAINFLDAHSLPNQLKKDNHPMVIDLSSVQFNNVVDKLNILEQFDGKNQNYYSSIFKVLIAEILSDYISACDIQNLKFPRWMDELISDMHQPLYISKPLTDIVKLSGFSYGHLSRLFKKYTAFSVSEYFRNVKMQYAANLLANSTLSVFDISEAVGYESPANFIIQFKKFSGKNPKNYRDSLIQ